VAPGSQWEGRKKKGAGGLSVLGWWDAKKKKKGVGGSHLGGKGGWTVPKKKTKGQRGTFPRGGEILVRKKKKNTGYAIKIKKKNLNIITQKKKKPHKLGGKWGDEKKGVGARGTSGNGSGGKKEKYRGKTKSSAWGLLKKKNT